MCYFELKWYINCFPYVKSIMFIARARLREELTNQIFLNQVDFLKSNQPNGSLSTDCV